MPATVEQTQSSSLVLLCVASWAIPGVGHLWLGRRSKGLILLIALPLMFAIGLAIHGRLFWPFPLDFSEPLAGLMAFADLGIGIPYFVATAFGYGAGDVRAVTYEYRQHVPNRGRTPQPSRRHRRVRCGRRQKVMQSHLLLLIVFAFFVSLVFAILTKDDVREQLRLGGMLFAGFVVAAIVAGWLMYPFPL